ncbi:hypothetical protein, unlikely [Trypanosoma brucei brucei TREU927]|uniref:Uncharacterized protein n=1 Tax=Trypanosoma brucei brucei (strain 927/4 GUTat10.1) TaxID=185431 RepID=Q38DW8_TRYB2|nr:hypothetical protein, unlikely [Trypanosoma brucei brucei TREU927]EAN77002.1 hypothetical protein, unlikely [Trypanosoma brucei brucei TREU927]
MLRGTVLRYGVHCANATALVIISTVINWSHLPHSSAVASFTYSCLFFSCVCVCKFFPACDPSIPRPARSTRRICLLPTRLNSNLELEIPAFLVRNDMHYVWTMRFPSPCVWGINAVMYRTNTRDATRNIYTYKYIYINLYYLH